MVLKRQALLLGIVLSLLGAAAAPGSADRPACVGIAGEYVTFFNGLLARQGIPHELVLDYQLTDPAILNRYDVLVVSELSSDAVRNAESALMAYVRAGGSLLLEGASLPPHEMAPGGWGRMREANEISAENLALAPFMAGDRRVAVPKHLYYADPGDGKDVIALARFERAGQLRRYGGDGHGSDALPAGAPAVWARPVGKGIFAYSGVGMGELGGLEGLPLDSFAEALIQFLARGKAVPQLVPEGIRLARKENALTLKVSDGAPAPPAPADDTPGPLPAGPGAASALPAGIQQVADAAETPGFNLAGTYQPARGSADLLLNYWNLRYHLSVRFAPGSAELQRIAAGKPAGKVALSLPRGAQVPFLVKERGGTVTLYAGGRSAVLAAPGLWRGATGARGAAFADLRFQPVEPPRFSDDFMRTDDQQGAWEVVSGTWRTAPVNNPDLSANPFTYTVDAPGTGLATAGYLFWDDYVLRASVRPVSETGAAGIVCYYQGPQNYLLLRAPLAKPGAQPAGCVELVRVEGGREHVLMRTPGCLLTGQWYRLAMRVHGSKVTAAIDGRVVASLQDDSLVEGRIALYARAGQARFDDVEVEPDSAPSPAPVVVDAGVPKYAGSIDRDTWATTATQWDADRNTPGLFWRRGRFFGDLRLSFPVPAPADAAPLVVASTDPRAGTRRRLPAAGAQELSLLLAPEASTPDAGYALRIRRDGPAGRRKVELMRLGKCVAAASLKAGGEPVLRLERDGRQITGWVDGRKVVAFADPHPIPRACRLGFLVEGLTPRISHLRLAADNVLDYTFDQAPADWWVGSGTWEINSRWSCTPDWSWFGGMSPDVAAIWHKQRFAGDVLLHFYAGPRMMENQEIARDINAVLCGDGKDVNSGYSFTVGSTATGLQGARLTRNGKLVAENATFRMPAQIHNRWLDMRVSRHGADVSLSVEGHQVLRWEDPEPLPSGYAGIWTRANGIMIARATIYYQRTTGEVLGAR